MNQQTIGCCEIKNDLNSDDSLTLCSAKWFTLDKLINTACEYITLLESRLTTDDIFKYFRLWIDGKYPKPKKLSVQVGESFNLWNILSELQNYSTRYAVIRDTYSFLIKHGDVTIATIRITVNDASKYMIEFSFM